MENEIKVSSGRVSGFVVIAKFLMILGLVSFGCFFVVGFLFKRFIDFDPLGFYIVELVILCTGFAVGVVAIIAVISKRQPAKALYSAVNSTVICGFSAIVTAVLVYVLYISKALGH